MNLCRVILLVAGIHYALNATGQAPGPQLPMNADGVVMQHLYDAAVAAQDVIMAPPVLRGSNRPGPEDRAGIVAD